MVLFVINELEIIWTETVMFQLKEHFQQFSADTRKAAKVYSQNSCCRYWDMNPRPPKHEVWALPLSRHLLCCDTAGSLTRRLGYGRML
jgi:hypothetical protein